MSGSRVDDVAGADGPDFSDVQDVATLTSLNSNGSSERTRWPSLEADLDLLGATPGESRPARVAIASYEFNGIVRNGGIGTACTSLAKALAAEGHEVDLFFTGWSEDPSADGFERWERRYARIGARLHWFDIDPLCARLDAPLFSAAHSYALYEQLRERDADQPYDVIHFVESIGHGFYPLLAKRQGLAFQKATTVVGVHSPRRWMAEAHGLPFDDPEDLGDEWMERRSIELADVVVSPSAHMLDWLRRRGVRLPARTYVQQYVTDFDRETTVPSESSSNEAPVEEFVFFGRLEQRKGLVVFCDALDELVERPVGSLKRVTFLGKQVVIEGAMSGDYIAARSEAWPWECQVISDLDRDAALDYLREPGRQAVMASPIDNSPNTVYEAIGLGINFLASDGGGIGELVHPDDREDFTYDPRDPVLEEIDPGDPRRMRRRHTGTVLAKRLERLLHRSPRRARFAVDPTINRETHLRWHRAAAGGARQSVAETEQTVRAPDGPPVVTVDVTDLRSVVRSRDGEGLVLIVDAAAERAPGLVATLVAAARRSPNVSFFTALGSFDIETPDGLVQRCFLPTGGPAVFGVAANCFGAGVVLTRRSALERLDIGTDGEPVGGVAGLLGRVALVGEQIDVVPEVLYRLPSTATHWDSLGVWADPFVALRPFHLAFQPEAADVAGMALRLGRDRYYLKVRAEEAEQAAGEAARALAVVTGSRSWRITGWLRSVAAAIRWPLKSRRA